MRKKILFVIHMMSYYGAEKIMAFLANEFSHDNYDVFLLTYENDNLIKEIDPNVIRIRIAQFKLSFYAIRRIFQILFVRKVCKTIKPDAIISFLTYPNMISILASIGTGIPVIISERGDPYAEQSWFTRLRDFIYNFADGYVFQTKGAKKYFNKRIQEKAIVIPNPAIIDKIPDKWTGNRDNIIVNVAHFVINQKRQDILIKAFSKIADKYQNLILVLFGEGEDEHEIIRIISDYNLEHRVVLAGITKNIYESIKKAKMFVLTSDYEGIPNALIEAMSVGLPCISTDCSPGGAAELIKNMENGILVKVGCIDELANAMEFVLDNPQIAEKLGQNATNVISALPQDEIIDQWMGYINKQISLKSTTKKR